MQTPDDFELDAEVGQASTSPDQAKHSADSQLDFEIGFLGGILERDPNYVEVLRVMANNLTAKGEYETSLELDRRLTRILPYDDVAHYNLACSYSVLGFVDAGLTALRRAIELGYDEFEYMNEDRDLETLRKDARFQEMIEEFLVR
jgi:tetratricopeptide (TPR) repeat protein